MQIQHFKVKVILDKSQFGNIQHYPGPGYSFYINNKGKFEYITTRSSQDLVAVTEEQYKNWSSRSIISIPVEIKI